MLDFSTISSVFLQDLGVTLPFAISVLGLLISVRLAIKFLKDQARSERIANHPFIVNTAPTDLKKESVVVGLSVDHADDRLDRIEAISRETPSHAGLSELKQIQSDLLSESPEKGGQINFVVKLYEEDLNDRIRTNRT